MITAKQIPNLPKGVHRYERGVYIRVTDHSRSWIFKYQLNGKRRELGLGSATAQTVSAVLARAAQYKSLVAQGLDPKNEMDRAKEEKRIETIKSSMPTFAEFADRAFEKILYLRRFQSTSSETAWQRDVDYLKEVFGKQRVNAISREDVVAMLRQWWTFQPRRGKDLRSRLYGILNVAKGEGLIDTNPAEWKGCLDAFLPPMGVVRRAQPEQHHAALSTEDLREVVQALWKEDNTVAMAIVFGALTAGRANEYIGGTWDEVDFETNTFYVPQSRRKDKKPYPHTVPLSRQAIALLNRLDTSGEYIFQGRNGHINGVSALYKIKSMTDNPVTLHGMRSTFSDWCAQNEKNFLVSEKQLMHAVGNEVFRAYQRDDLLEKRRVLMQEWADFLLPNV